MKSQAIPGTTIYERISLADGETISRCFDFCNKYGQPQPQDRPELAATLASICLENGDPALKELADMHPDRDFILANAGQPLELIDAYNDRGAGSKHHNCSGKCSCGAHMHDTGLQMPALNTSNSSELLINAVVLLLVGAGVVTLFSVVIKNIAK